MSYVYDEVWKNGCANNCSYSGMRSALDSRPHFPKARKFALGMLPQPLQNTPHLTQFSLQLCPSLVVRPSVELEINLTLDRGRLFSDVLRHCLSYELRIESGLHKCRKGVFRA